MLEKFFHQGLVHMQTACGVEEHHVKAFFFCMLHCGPGNIHRICRAHLKDGDAKLTADDLQLLNGGGTIDVTGYQQGLLAVFFMRPASFAPLVVLPAPEGPPALRWWEA